MKDPKDEFFEFLLPDNYLMVVARADVIALKQLYPDDLDIIMSAQSKVRCQITVQQTDTTIKEYYSIEKMKELRNRLYGRFFTGTKIER